MVVGLLDRVGPGAYKSGSGWAVGRLASFGSSQARSAYAKNCLSVLQISSFSKREPSGVDETTEPS